MNQSRVLISQCTLTLSFYRHADFMYTCTMMHLIVNKSPVQGAHEPLQDATFCILIIANIMHVKATLKMVVNLNVHLQSCSLLCRRVWNSV